jgi:hypothetical protein
MSTIAAGPAVTRLRAFRGLLFPLGVYALTSLFAAVIVVIAGRNQIAANLLEFHPSGSMKAAPGYSTIVTNWDGQWYRAIANHGYPGNLPVDSAGRVTQNAWAFYPLYPLLVGVLMWVTGWSFALVGPAVSVVLGAVAVVVLFRLVQDALGKRAASMATVLICTFMSAPVLQTAYTESLALLLLSSSLLLLRRRRYAWTALVIVLLALTRNVVLAMAPVIMLHGAVRWRTRAHDPFTTHDRLAVGGLTVLAVAGAGLWPAIAAAATGQVSAYTETMAAWGGKLRILIVWPRTFFDVGGPAGLLLFLLLLFLLYGLLARPAARRWGPELWGWAVAYPSYLILATAIGSSTPRHWLLAFPLSLLAVDFLCLLRPHILRTCALGVTACSGLALQWVWVSSFLVLGRVAHQIFP